MAESFENLEDILSDWVNEDVEKSLTEAVDKFQKQEEGKNHVSLKKTAWTRAVSGERH